MALEALKGKMVYLGGARVFVEFFESLEGFSVKEQGLLRSLGIFRGFWLIFGGFRVV
jgi:hypothetical protein